MTNQYLDAEGMLDPRFLEKSYQEATDLILAVARYLEGESEQFKETILSVEKEVYYASESMRVSSCLMHIMSWFLVQKGVAAGEITKAEAAAPKFRLGAKDISIEKVDNRDGDLPEPFVKLMNSACKLYKQVARMDEMVYGSEEATNPVHEMFSRIENKKPID